MVEIDKVSFKGAEEKIKEFLAVGGSGKRFWNNIQCFKCLSYLFRWNLPIISDCLSFW